MSAPNSPTLSSDHSNLWDSTTHFTAEGLTFSFIEEEPIEEERTPDRLITTLIDIETISPNTPRDPTHQKIQQALNDPECSAKMSIALLHHINEPAIHNCIETVGPALLKPRFNDDLSEEQCLQFIELRMTHCWSLEDLEEAFPPSNRTDRLLQLFKARDASKEQKMVIESYLSQRFFQRVRSITGTENSQTLEDLLKELWSASHSNQNVEERREKVKKEVAYRGINIDNDLQLLLKRLKQRDIAELAKGAGCGKKREELIDDLEKLYPQIILPDARKSFMETFQELEGLATTLFDLIEQTSENGLCYFDTHRTFAQLYPLKEEAILKGAEFLESDRYINWHQIYMANLCSKHPAETFDKQYNSNASRIKQKMVTAFLTSLPKESDSVEELAFLKGCLEDFYSNQTSFLMKELESNQKRENLIAFLNGERCQTLSKDESSLNNFRHHIMSFLESRKKLEAFQQKFDVPDFIAQCWEPIHLEGRALTLDTLHQIRRKCENRKAGTSLFDDDNSVKCARLLEQRDVIEWMKENSEPYLIPALKKAVKNSSFRLHVLLNIDSILIKFHNELQDEECRQFLKSSLRDIGFRANFRFDRVGYKMLLAEVGSIGKDLKQQQVEQLHNVVRLESFSKALVEEELRHAREILNIHFIFIQIKSQLQDQESQEFVKKILMEIGSASDSSFDQESAEYQDLVNNVRQIEMDFTLEQITTLQNVMNGESLTSLLPPGNLRHLPEILNEAFQPQGSCSIM